MYFVHWDMYQVLCTWDMYFVLKTCTLYLILIAIIPWILIYQRFPTGEFLMKSGFCIGFAWDFNAELISEPQSFSQIWIPKYSTSNCSEMSDLCFFHMLLVMIISCNKSYDLKILLACFCTIQNYLLSYITWN